jgi:hypothetical protein
VTAVRLALATVAAATAVTPVALAGPAFAAVAVLALAVGFVAERRVRRVAVAVGAPALAGHAPRDSLLAVAPALTAGARGTGVVALVGTATLVRPAAFASAVFAGATSAALGVFGRFVAGRPVTSPSVRVTVAGFVVVRPSFGPAVLASARRVGVVASSSATLPVAVGGVPVLVRVSFVRGMVIVLSVLVTFVAVFFEVSPVAMLSIAALVESLFVRRFAPSLFFVRISHVRNPRGDVTRERP